jgi:hypothetical protein
VTCEVVLDLGAAVTGTVLGLDGKPLMGVLASGLAGMRDWEYKPLPSAEFRAGALRSGQRRLLQFTHPEKGLAGYLVLRGDEKGPLTVKLGPAGALTGRLVTPDRQPLDAQEIIALRDDYLLRPGFSKQEPALAGSFPNRNRITVGKDGKFRIEGLAPGLEYILGILKGTYLLRPSGKAAGPLTIKPGETLDLDDVEVKPIE